MSAEILRLILFPALLAAGLLVPGWLLGRALRTPGGPAGAFLGSAALLTNLLLLLDAIDAPRLALALGLVCALLGAIAYRRSSPPSLSAEPAREPFRWRAYHWLLVPAFVGIVAITSRTLLDPLSGLDTHFRWDFLARQIVRLGNLDFYPAVNAEDFLSYGWCDGIAPLVAGVYAWSYFSLGRMETWAITPAVLGQSLLLFVVVWRLAMSRGGQAAGAGACALLATSTIFLWSLSMGQETALTALSLVSVFWFIEQRVAGPRGQWLIWAGIAAGTGGLAREYGLSFIALGGLALAWHRLPMRDWLAFMGAALAVALPWYMRNWIKTGHPLYCLELGSLFPTNPVYLEYNHVVAATYGITQNGATALTALPKLALSLAGGPLLFGLIAGARRWRENGPWLIALIAVIVLWLWSIGLTSGGYMYSMRVLTPAIALGAILGGVLLARFAAVRYSWILALVCTVVAIDACGRSLYLPARPVPSWREMPVLAWRDLGRERNLWRENANWQSIVDAAEQRKILVSDPALHAVLVERGASPVPFFSPEVRFLFDPVVDFETGRAQLRAAGFRFILVTRFNGFIDTQLSTRSFFQALATTSPVLSTPLYFVYDLYQPVS